MPFPTGQAIERFGEERARELLAIGADTPIGQIIEEVLDAQPPGGG